MLVMPHTLFRSTCGNQPLFNLPESFERLSPNDSGRKALELPETVQRARLNCFRDNN